MRQHEERIISLDGECKDLAHEIINSLTKDTRFLINSDIDPVVLESLKKRLIELKQWKDKVMMVLKAQDIDKRMNEQNSFRDMI